MNDSNNHHIFAVNTICNYDKDIIPYIKAKIGSVYIRVDGNSFGIDDGSKPIFLDRQIDNLRLKEFVCILDLEYFVREYEEQEVAVCVIFLDKVKEVF